MRTDRILIHWACSKIKKSNDDVDTICKMVVEKLANKPGLSYAEIAMTAHKAGQSTLATMVSERLPYLGICFGRTTRIICAPTEQHTASC